MSGHLTCQCHRANPDAARSLCGLGVALNSPQTIRDAPVMTTPTVADQCVVCHDLAQAAIDAGGCEQCRTTR